MGQLEVVDGFVEATSEGPDSGDAIEGNQSMCARTAGQSISQMHLSDHLIIAPLIPLQ